MTDHLPRHADGIGDGYPSDLSIFRIFPVHPLPYAIVISLLALAIFFVSTERTATVADIAPQSVTATTAEPAPRQSLISRAAYYRQNQIDR